MPIDQENKEEARFSLKGVFQKGKEYVETKLEILKLIAIAKASRIIARLLLDVFRGVLALLVLFFLSMALGFYLSALLDNYALGFLATAGIFIVIIIILSAFSHTIRRKIVDISIKKIFDDLDDDEEDAKNDLNNTEKATNQATAWPTEAPVSAQASVDSTGETKNTGAQHG